MISVLQQLDTALFRFINQTCANDFFDWLMPKLAAPKWFIPAVIVALALLICKGGRRGRICALLLVAAVALTDGLVCNSIKHAVDRVRPCIALTDARCLLGMSRSGSMPSSHAANWFAATTICFILYRRSWRIMLPLAALVSFSRVYDGVHYPSDVLAGAVLGSGCAIATVLSADVLWRWLGRAWFPLWWSQLSSLVEPGSAGVSAASANLSAVGQGTASDPLRIAQADQQWLRLGYILTGALLLFRILYLASGTIELSGDEAYQWLWSKHLALSYFSKPPAIAYIQYAGTHLWGDTELGVRFFSPVFAAILSIVVLRFLAKEIGARTAFLALLIVTSSPLLSVGTILMTIDPPLVLCWTLALVAGWRAVQPSGTTGQWLLVGLAAGLGFLSKYSAAYLIVCFGLFFVLWPPSRVQLRKPGPYLALLVLAVCTLPVIIWNAQHNWATVYHVAANAGIDTKWKPTFRFLAEFTGLQFALLNPVFFVGALWAVFGFWKQRRENPLGLYFFCTGGVVFLAHWLFSLHSRVMPNWIAPAVVPMYCLMLLYWQQRWRNGERWFRGWLIGGLSFGLAAVVLFHNTNLVAKLVGHPLPGDMDPLRRVRGYKESAAWISQARINLLKEGKPVFIICDHYGITGLFTFYMPEARQSLVAAARENAGAPSAEPAPLVYYKTVPQPNNQLFFWPEYKYAERRKGQNAIFVVEAGTPKLEPAWPWKWLRGQDIATVQPPKPARTPPVLLQQFESVTDLGVHEIKLSGRVFKRLQLFECRNLR
jgi:membrane-associated phospholipid phosphatase